MLFQRVNRTDAEKVFIIVQNVRGSAFAAGDAVVMDGSASADGVRVTVCAAATLGLFVGVCAAAIANSAYGLVQCYGYNSAANVINDITTAQTVGNYLGLVAGSVNLGGASGSAAPAVGTMSHLAYALETFGTNATPTATTKKVFIRAM